MAKLRPGTPKTSSSAEKSEAKMRREVQASRMRPGHWKRFAFSTNERSASIDSGSRWITAPRTSSMLPLKAASKEPSTAMPSEIRKISSGTSESSV